MILWGAAFGVMKTVFLRNYNDDDEKFLVHHDSSDNYGHYKDHWNNMVNAAYIDLAGLILFLISGVMGLVLFFIGRRSGSGGHTKASYV